MTIVSTTGHILYSNSSWDGNKNDSHILSDILNNPGDHEAREIVDLIKQNDVILVLDRGFRLV